MEETHMTNKLKIMLGLSAASAFAVALHAVPAVADGIDLGPFCTGQCAETLALKADPASIKGTVGFPVASLTFPYGVALKQRTEEAAAKYFPGIKLIVGDGQNDPSTQTALVDNYIAQKVNVIIINAVEKDALAPAVKRAMDAGIKVVEVDRTVSTPVTVTIKANDYDIGFAAGKRMIETLGGKGNVVELQGSAAASPTIDRHKGFMDAIASAPGIKVVGSNNADYDEAKGLQVMEDFLTRFPAGQIDAVFTHADMMARGAAKAIQAENRQAGLKVVSIDGENSTIDMIAAGVLDSTTIYPVVAPMDIVAAAKLIAGEPLPEFVKLDSPTVTKENADQFKGKGF
jgi:ribose transport system substrate-binding protein